MAIFNVDLEEAEEAACTTRCSDDSPCGGPRSLVSVFDTFKAFSTLDLKLKVTNLLNEDIEAKTVGDAPATSLSDVSKSKAISTREV